MAVNTKTLSVRVPIDVASLVENTCKQRGITRNQLLTECIASQGVVGVNNFGKGGVAKPMDDTLTQILIGVGGVATGTVVYHLLNNNLPKSWDKETREMISIISAIGSAFAMAYGLDKATHK
jgi:pyridoxal biosynthesis lyase PdxS